MGLCKDRFNHFNLSGLVSVLNKKPKIQYFMLNAGVGGKRSPIYSTNTTNTAAAFEHRTYLQTFYPEQPSFSSS